MENNTTFDYEIRKKNNYQAKKEILQNEDTK